MVDKIDIIFYYLKQLIFKIKYLEVLRVVSKKGTMLAICEKHEEFCPSLGCNSIVLAIGREMVDFDIFGSIDEIDVGILNQKILEKAREKFQELLRNKNPSCELSMQEKWEDWGAWNAMSAELKVVNKRLVLVITMPEGEFSLLPEEVKFNIKYLKNSWVIELLEKLKSKEIKIENLEEEQKKDMEKIITSVQREVESIKWIEEIINK